jgi:epoxyqueuosine reductase
MLSAGELKRLLLEAGGAAVGFATLQEVEPEVFKRYEQWIAEGNNAEMGYLANNLAIRRNPALLLANGTDPQPGGTVISIAFPYYSGNPYRPGCLKFARYALGDDYHEVLRHRLLPIAAKITETTGCEARICVDTAPILERYWAVKAGLGFIGMNHQLIIPGIGSYIFLAEIVTRAILPPDEPCALSCNNCGACLRACPAGALSRQSLSEPSIFKAANAQKGAEPISFNEGLADEAQPVSFQEDKKPKEAELISFKAGLCNSYLTIEHRGEFPYNPKLSPNRIYGCDLCLEACPLAAPTAAPAASSAAAFSAGSTSSPSSAAFFAAKAQALPEFEPRKALLKLTKADILALTQEGFSLLFRHSPIKRAKLLGLLRNARAL